MRRPAVFFDRDNTLIACDGYLGDPSKVVLVEGAANAVARCRQLGYAVVVFSNQSGVARGMFTEEAVHAVNSRMDELLTEANPAAIIDRHEFCPFHPDGIVEQYRGESQLRKPAPGMILQAAHKLALDVSRSWVIGDAPRDIDAGKAAGCRTILFQHPQLTPSAAQAAESKVLPDHFVQSLQAAINIIEKADNDEQIGNAAAMMSPTTTEISEANSSASADVDLSKIENLLTDVLDELRKPIEPTTRPFSITKLLAGVMQVISLTVLGFSYWSRPERILTTLAIAIMLQLFTITLLIMDRQE